MTRDTEGVVAGGSCEGVEGEKRERWMREGGRGREECVVIRREIVMKADEEDRRNETMKNETIWKDERN